MRTVLRWVFTRYGIAGILVLAVLVVVGLARLTGGEADRPGSARPGVDPYASISLGPDDGVYHATADPNDPPPESSQEPELPRGLPDPRPVAERFAASWADHEDIAPATWRIRLSRYATRSLMDRLAGADPASVPTDRVTGKARLVTVAGRTRVDVTLEAKGGLLVLSLTYTDRWAVDSVDWRRG